MELIIAVCLHTDASCFVLGDSVLNYGFLIKVLWFTLRVEISRHLTIRFDFDSEGCDAMTKQLSMHLDASFFFCYRIFFSLCDCSVLSKQHICNESYLIYFQYIWLIKQMKEMGQVNWKVTFASKHPRFAKDQQEKKIVPVAAYT